VPEGEQSEYRILTGPWVPTLELADALERQQQLQAEQDESVDEPEGD